MDEFCSPDGGAVLWEKVVKFNSGAKRKRHDPAEMG